MHSWRNKGQQTDISKVLLKFESHVEEGKPSHQSGGRERERAHFAAPFLSPNPSVFVLIISSTGTTTKYQLPYSAALENRGDLFRTAWAPAALTLGPPLSSLAGCQLLTSNLPAAQFLCLQYYPLWVIPKSLVIHRVNSLFYTKRYSSLSLNWNVKETNMSLSPNSGPKTLLNMHVISFIPHNVWGGDYYWDSSPSVKRFKEMK